MTYSEIPSRVDEIDALLGWQRQSTPREVLGNRGAGSGCHAAAYLVPGWVFRRITIDSPVAGDQAWGEYKYAFDELLQILGDEDLEYLDNVDYTLCPEPGGLLRGDPMGTVEPSAGSRVAACAQSVFSIGKGLFAGYWWCLQSPVRRASRASRHAVGGFLLLAVVIPPG
ncbi:hypothetical protein [Amycolatopsis sp. BJA-103]|uniref:hypothetical protein n=1 Tax=Amycolatopsis sp. BJA-103 TaxID=1911175 RepID=UPI001E5D7953|nr:hypothetical protein [Amycolatopsis sp. BJA-103]